MQCKAAWSSTLRTQVSAENVFRDARGAFKRGSAAVISKAFVGGLYPPECRVKVESKLDMKGHWKDKPEKVFDLVRDVAMEWCTVELADKQRHPTRTGQVTPRGKTSATKLAEKSTGGADRGNY